jgi:DNA-binding response OmpR family regulator
MKALDIIETDPSLNVIIASVSMPMRSGWDILKYAKQNQKTHYIPVIMTADSVDGESVLNGYKMGAADFIVKPFSETIVIEKIRKVLLSIKPTVLIVDDEPEILSLLKQIIELNNFGVFTALSAEEGLDILDRSYIHAIVSDIILPGMTGVELMAVVKEKRRDLPVILITGHSGRFTPKYVMESGADGYFTKPFNTMDLIRKLKQIMPNYFQRSEATSAEINIRKGF